MVTKKLIEVALPLDKINEASIAERYAHSGHPFQLHMYWARRPLASTRAVVWASLVDDPSSHPELFPTEEEQRIERERLFRILGELVSWDNTNNVKILDEARQEIEKHLNGQLPELLDVFGGGGAIPLEAQRLGLTVRSHDLNPVAIMINKAMIEIPPLFRGLAPVNRSEQERLRISNGWERACGLAEDVKYYGDIVKKKAFKKIGYLYPEIDIPKENGGGKGTIIAWIWARTVKCPNPACSCNIPLVSNYVLSNKKGKEIWIEPVANGTKLSFEIRAGKCPKGKESSKQGRSAVFKCPICGETTTDKYVKQCGINHQIGLQLMATVVNGARGKIYLKPDIEQELLARIERPDNYPDGMLPNNPRWFSPPAFGFTQYADLFTNRQILSLVTFGDAVKEIGHEIELDAIKSGLKDDHIPLSEGGTGALAYSQAIQVYLSFVIDKIADYNSTLCHWQAGGGKAANTFNRQALPMVWDFAEANVFSNAYGGWTNKLKWTAEGIENLPAGSPSKAEQFDAQSDCGLRNIMVSTDPPYYDNIGYADLSDFFYLWMRHNLKEIYPTLFSFMQVPKAEELVATPYHFEGSAKRAKEYFENGMLQTCKRIFEYAREDIPVTIYYAYKQNDSDKGSDSKASSGWETMLNAIVQAGFSITGTWPIRTELANRAISLGTNALASSIILVCRKRSQDSPQITRRNLVSVLRSELRPALKRLQESNIAPVDLAQSAIGPGMGVFSRYRRVLEANGNPMTVRSALQVINEEIDLYFNEQVGDLDSMSRFCVDLYTQNAFNEMSFGDANTLATAKNTSIATMASYGMLYAQKGKVHLIERPELPEIINQQENCIWLLCQQLTYRMEKEGIEGCARAIFNMFGSNAERAKDLAYRLYTIADRKKWVGEAYAYNALVVAWPDIQTRAAMLERETPQQIDLFEAGLIE